MDMWKMQIYIKVRNLHTLQIITSTFFNPKICLLEWSPNDLNPGYF